MYLYSNKRNRHLAITALGISFMYNGHEVIWLWPWKREKYLLVPNGLRYRSLHSLYYDGIIMDLGWLVLSREMSKRELLERYPE